MQNKAISHEPSRRRFLSLAAGSMAAGCLASTALPGCASSQYAGTGATKRDIVLVHGAWHGGWCWDQVRPILEAAGHRVFTPTLTGLGSRADELTSKVGLNTHIADIIEVITANDLSDIVLCGHSYGGMVITGVADALKSRIAHIVYLDAALPNNGETMLSYGEPRPQVAIDGAIAAMTAMATDGVGIGVFPPALLGIPEDHPLYTWVADRLTPHPLKTWLDPISLSNDGPKGLPSTYVHCNQPALAQTQFGWLFHTLQSEEDWNTLLLATGHDAMVTDPEGVAKVLLNAAAHSPPKMTGGYQ
ncbi:MAG: alpha/beta fold hydrolase [Pseudomonadota bacterium]